jgi:hypothetical protein
MTSVTATPHGHHVGHVNLSNGFSASFFMVTDKTSFVQKCLFWFIQKNKTTVAVNATMHLLEVIVHFMCEIKTQLTI